jgi:hypothetical protein
MNLGKLIKVKMSAHFEVIDSFETVITITFRLFDNYYREPGNYVKVLAIIRYNLIVIKSYFISFLNCYFRHIGAFPIKVI